MKKLFYVVLFVLFALPAVANTPIKKEIKILSKEVKTPSKKTNKLKYTCVTTTLSCGLSGKVCGEGSRIPGLVIMAEENHCRFD